MSSLKSALRALPVLAAAMLLSACGVNTIPTLDEQVKAEWAGVQTQYQRRADLIPNLVATVQGYAAQERDVLVAVTEARASATQPQFDASTITDPAKFEQFQQAQDNLSGVLGRLMLIQERYPDLKSNQNFLALQSQLEGTENRIAIARRDYNEAARVYNTEIRTFPGALWAGTVHRWAKPAQMFTATPQAQTAPTVTFERPTAPTVNGATPGAGPAPMPTPSTTTTVPATNTVQ